MTTRTLKSTLRTAAAVIALTGAAAAANLNSIGIDVSGTGSTSTLAITQDDARLANYASNVAGNGSLPVRGPWSTLNASALTNGLTILGAGNTLTNSVAASGAVALNQTITGSNNTIGNTVSSVASFTHNLALTGSGNTIANTANGGGAKTIGQTITGSNNAVSVGLTGTGTQSSSLTTGSGTLVDFTQASAADNSAAAVGLSNVIGASGAAAKVMLTQTALADNATANVNVAGGVSTMGLLMGSLRGIALPANNPGVYVYQNSPGATVNAVVTAGANGFTAKFIQ